MLKVSLDKIISYEEECRNILPFDEATLKIALSRVMMHKIIDNNNQLPCTVRLENSFPDDVILDLFSRITDKKVTINQLSSCKIVTLT